MHWRNSFFQIKYFLAGKCHTPDEAYRLLCELYEDRDTAIRNAEASSLRQEAKRIRALQTISKGLEQAEVIEAKADLVELQAFKKQQEDVLEVAVQERTYIKSLIDKIQPYRKYKHLSDKQAHQEAQQDEWKEELIWRANNFLASQGMIPPDQLMTMRLHPEWKTSLLPRINDTIKALVENKNITGNPISCLEGHTIPLLKQILD